MRLWQYAREFDRQTKEKGCHGGAIGHTGLQVLQVLIFDFLNFATGRLDPSQAAIARKAKPLPACGVRCAQAAAQPWDPDLGAPMRRELARRALRAPAADQRLRHLAGNRLAWLLPALR